MQLEIIMVILISNLYSLRIKQQVRMPTIITLKANSSGIDGQKRTMKRPLPTLRKRFKLILNLLKPIMNYSIVMVSYGLKVGYQGLRPLSA
jgi:ABC-type branched-subunit amino acid transport system permease subunit